MSWGGEEMTQTLYAHMNKRKKKNKFRKVLATLLFNIVFVSKVLDKEMK
jgi:DNA-dependent RNA polymerase auxiliary subunit epsilon